MVASQTMSICQTHNKPATASQLLPRWREQSPDQALHMKAFLSPLSDVQSVRFVLLVRNISFFEPLGLTPVQHTRRLRETLT